MKLFRSAVATFAPGHGDVGSSGGGSCRSSFRRFSLCAALLVLGVFFSSCGGDGGGSGDDELIVHRLEYELREGTIELDAEQLEALKSLETSSPVAMYLEADALQLTIEPDSTLSQAIVPGAVLLAGETAQAPYGLLHRVASIEETPEGLVVEAERTSLVAAFESLDLSVEGEIPASELEWGETPSVVGPKLGHTFGGDVDWVVFDGDGDPLTDEDQVRLFGTVEAGVHFSFSISFDAGALDGVDLTAFPPDLNPLDIELEVDFDLDLSTDVSVRAEGRAALSFRKEQAFPPIYLPPIGTPPLVFVPRLQAVALIEGGLPGEFEVQTGVRSEFSSGASLSSSGAVTPRLSTPSLEPTESDADAELTGELRAEMSLEVALLLAGIVGPQGGFVPWSGLMADVEAEPCWTANVGFDGFVGLVIELFSIRLVNLKYVLPVADYQVASGDCPEGQSFDPPPSWSRAWLDALDTVSPSDEMRTFLKPAIDGHALLAGTGSRGLMKVSRDGDFLWGRSFVRTDTVLREPLQIRAVSHRNDTGLLAAAQDGVLLWLDAAGRLERATVLEPENAASFDISDMLLDADGNLWLATEYRAEGSTRSDIVVIRYGVDGTMSANRWGLASWADEPGSFFEWNDGVVLVVSSQDFVSNPDAVSYLVEFERSGSLKRAMRVSAADGQSDTQLRVGGVTEDGDVVAAGIYTDTAPAALMVNIATNGTVGWATEHRTTDLIGLDISAISQQESGAWLLAGTRIYPSPDDFFVARSDSVGRFAWTRRFGGASAEVSPAMLDNGDGTILVAAPSGSLGEDDEDSWWVSRLDIRDAELELPGTSPLTTSDESISYHAVDMQTEVVTEPLQSIDIAEASPVIEESAWSPTLIEVVP
jgi:hypothetical protein